MLDNLSPPTQATDCLPFLDKPGTLGQIEQLALLAHDWNGYGACPIDLEVIQAATDLIKRLPIEAVSTWLPRGSPMSSATCPQCGRSTVFSGGITHGPDTMVQARNFVPTDQLPIWRAYPGILLMGEPQVCVSCGHLWSSVDPQDLRKYIQAHGSELLKQRLDESDHGPYRGLPETDLAREIADKISEIDALVQSSLPGFVGKYRELRGVTWDQAIKETRHWRDLTREEKLALFGWESKKKGPVDDLDSPCF